VDYDAIEYDPTVMENELDGFSSCLRFSKGLVQLFSGVYVYAFFVCMCLCVCHQRLRRSPHNTHARYIHTGTTVLVMIPLAFLTCFHWYLRKCVVCVCVCVCVCEYVCVCPVSRMRPPVIRSLRLLHLCGHRDVADEAAQICFIYVYIYVATKM
jgi:hypothetical protein